jgi:hypothetical protein
MYIFRLFSKKYIDFIFNTEKLDLKHTNKQK